MTLQGGLEVDKRAYFEKIGYVPHSAAQWEYHDSNARFRIPICGRRFGKSTMAARDRSASLLNPTKSTYGWIVGPTYALGEKEFRVMWNDLIVKMRLGRDKRIKKAYNVRSGEMYIRFPWDSWVEVKSATHQEGLVGDALHWVIMSEAAKHNVETWERMIRPALTDYRGEADFPTTPEGQNWVYDLWKFGQNPDIKEYASWQYPSWLNSIIYPDGLASEELALLKLTTSHEWFQQEIAASFTTFVGRIYDEFEFTSHVKKCEFNPLWPNYMCMINFPIL